MKEKFPVHSSIMQSSRIKQLIGDKISGLSYFTVNDLFGKILPLEVTIDGKRGDLSITGQDICYFNVGSNWTMHIVLCHMYEPSEDVFDAAIKILETIYDKRSKETS